MDSVLRHPRDCVGELFCSRPWQKYWFRSRFYAKHFHLFLFPYLFVFFCCWETSIRARGETGVLKFDFLSSYDARSCESAAARKSNVSREYFHVPVIKFGLVCVSGAAPIADMVPLKAFQSLKTTFLPSSTGTTVPTTCITIFSVTST